MTDFDLSRLSNAGKEAARAHRQLRKAADKIDTLVEEAKEAGLSPKQVEQAFLRFCSGREEMTDAASLFVAATQRREKAST